MKFSLFSGGSVDYVIVGLGNPGAKYEHTRHNAGFLAIDKIAEKWNISVSKLKFNGLHGLGKVGDKKVLLVKPVTYMNNSGSCVSQFLNFYKVPPQRLIVICDDISLDVGRMRIRRNGSHGGHNGLRDIEAMIGSREYPRVKVGIGKKPHPQMDLADWVLSKFTAADLKVLDTINSNCEDTVRLLMNNKIDEAMNRYNS